MACLTLPALLLVLSTAALDGGVAPPSQLHVRAEPNKAQLGEPFVVELVVTHDPKQRYELKTPSDLGDFEYLGQARSRADGPDSSTTTVRVRLAAYVLGTLKTPTLTLDVIEPDGSTQLETAGTSVEIVSSLPPDAQSKGAGLYDVRPPEELPIRTWRVLYALAGLVAAGLLAWAIRRAFARRKLNAVLNQPPPKPLDVRTLEALDALAALNLPAQSRFKDFYFRLSEIVRSYLGELYAFEALESTTPELIEALNGRHTPGLAVNDLTAFASASDFIRYAKTEPTPADCKQHLELAYRIVHETTVATRALRASTPGTHHGPQ